MTRKRSILAVAAVGITLLALTWYMTYPRGILMGDDLRLVYDIQHGGYGSTPFSALTASEFNTYRPLLMLIFWIIVPVFGTHFQLYQGLNALVELSSTLVIGVCAYRLSRGSAVVALCVAVAFAFSRLTYYAISQLLGLMEGLGLLLTLLVVLDLIDAYRLRSPKLLVRSALWFGLSIFVDERYIVVAPFAVAAILVYYGRNISIRSLAYAAIPAAFLAANIGIKTFVLHTHFLTGTGQPLVFNTQTTLAFLESGLFNILGFNVGPSYLSGGDVADIGLTGYIAGLLMAVPFIFAAAAFVYACIRARSKKEASASVLYALLWLLLFLSLLLSASINTRQEFRWLYAPFAVAVIGLAGGASYFSEHRRAIRIAAVSFVAGAVCCAVIYRMHAEDVYFFYSERIARDVARIVAKRPNNPVVIVKHGEATIEDWVFMGREFFDEAGTHSRIAYTNDVGDVHGLGFPIEVHPTVIDVQGRLVSELVQAEQPPAKVAIAQKRERLTLSFVHDFARGKINSLLPASTPTGRGVFVNAWPSPSGQRLGLTVLASYRYDYSGIRVTARTVLRFSSAAPYPIGKGAHAFVSVKNGATTTRVYDEDLLPATAAGPIWEDHEIPLDHFAGKRIAVEFGADVRDGDPTAAWAIFGTPALFQ